MSTKKPTIKTIASKINEILLDEENTEKIVDDDVWSVVQSFVDENGLNSSQIKHYNMFIYETAQSIVDQFRQVKIEENGKTYTIEFGEIFFSPPRHIESDDSGDKLYPTEALQRNITYASALHGDIIISPPSGEPSFYEKIPLGMVPVMVLSDLCNLKAIINDPIKIALHNESFTDSGGYFVISPKGENAIGVTAQRRVLCPQERPSANRIQIFTNRRKQSPKYTTYAEVRSSGNGLHTTTTTLGIMGSKKRISAVLPWIDTAEIPIGVLFKALGIVEEYSMSILVLGLEGQQDTEALDFLISSLEYSYECSTQEAALIFIGKKGRKFVKEDEDLENFIVETEDAEGSETDAEGREDEGTKKEISEEKIKKDSISYATRLLSLELFPHVGSGENSFMEKAKYLGYMIQKLIWVILERRTPEQRDHYMNKRILTAHGLLSQQFYGAFRRLIMEITNNTKKALKTGNNVNILSWIKPSIITNAMSGAISGNNWYSGGPSSKGIAQLYEEFNHSSGISNMRKLVVYMAAEGGKVIEPRDLHGSHFGIVCVTGDTIVVLADGVSTCRIDQLEGRPVMTVNPDTLKSEPSGIYNFFKTVPKRLLSISDNCGRVLRCTPDHPFLVHRRVLSDVRRTDVRGKNIWVNAGDLKITDTVVTFSRSSKISTSKIFSIEDIPPEPVYDFTTISENHSFIANGFVTHQCPSDTPEGKKAGLMKNMALSALITVGSDPEPVKIMVKGFLGNKAEKSYPASLSWTKVFINGMPIGETDEPEKLVNALVRSRREARLNPETSITFSKEYNEIQIAVDGGRLCRPLFIVDVESGELKFRMEEVVKLEAGSITWTELLATGTVELVDKAEEENYIIAGYPSELEGYEKSTLDSPTHCEIHPSLMYGIGGSIIPFPDHNQCIYEEEMVLMSNDTQKKIKDIVPGDEIINFNPKTGKKGTARVTDVLSKLTNKQMYRIEIGNRFNITATYDHKFIVLCDSWSPRGKPDWIPLSELDVGDSVGISRDLYYKNKYIPPVKGRWYSTASNDLMWISITKKEPVSRTRIADITTDSPYQSFFAGDGFGVHNSPRNCYQSSMGKQAVGVPFTNYRQIMCGTFHTLQYMQKPLCLSRAGSIIKFDQMPSGQNAMTAVICREYNEEDSTEMNADSIQRGFMVSYKWTCYYCEIREEKRESFGIPSEKCEKVKGNVSKLMEGGFPKSGTVINTGDAVIGKITEKIIGTDDDKKIYYSDNSLIYDHAWPATVDKIMIGISGDGYKFIRVMLCQKREPVVGDKFSFRHGQKGIVGKLRKTEDLPYNAEGIVPDIIINSLAFPSRMTIAMLMELLAGKVIVSSSPLHQVTVTEALGSTRKDEREETPMQYKSFVMSDKFKETFISPTDPTCIDATPYRLTGTRGGETKVNVIREEMAKYGFDCGDERMTCGITGKKLRCLVFYGPVFLQKLKHFVIDKIHGRAKGGRTTLMRQPKEGRALGGGLRIGERRLAHA